MVEYIFYNNLRYVVGFGIVSPFISRVVWKDEVVYTYILFLGGRTWIDNTLRLYVHMQSIISHDDSSFHLKLEQMQFMSFLSQRGI